MKLQAKQQNRFWRVLPTLALLLASCSGGSGGGTQPQPTPTPTPAPTPAPTPTPTPTPTPAPVAYMVAWDFTRDRSFNAIGLRIANRSSAGPPDMDVRLDPESASIGFDFFAATRTYQARYNSDSITAMTQIRPSGQLVSNETNSDFFGDSTGLFSRTPLRISRDLIPPGIVLRSTYVGSVNWSSIDMSPIVTLGTLNVNRLLLFGARTIASELPSSGKPIFGGQSVVTGPGGDSDGDATVVVDFAARTVEGTTTYIPAFVGSGARFSGGVVLDEIRFSGTLDPGTGRISGTAQYVRTGETGRFEGALYGPAGLEVGILFVIGPANAARYGVLAARR